MRIINEKYLISTGFSCVAELILREDLLVEIWWPIADVIFGATLRVVDDIVDMIHISFRPPNGWLT